MTNLGRYIAYLKNNPQGYWFKRRLFGWGWIPVKLQGWAVIGLYTLILVLLAFRLDEDSTSKDAMLTLILPLILLTAVLITICYKKGEKPKWQWGLPEEEDID